jgi:hypothetical protein
MNISTLDFSHPLSDLAFAFDELLCEGSMSRRLAHHIAHVGPEDWLSMELAFLVNNQEVEELNGWRAVLERARIDVTLIPAEATKQQVFLELKVVDRAYWGEAWTGVYDDLVGKRKSRGQSKDKPPANAAICFIVKPSCKTFKKTQAKTLKKWADQFSRLPHVVGERFVPLSGQPPLKLLHSSPVIELDWQHPVHERWPEGYKAHLTVLWVALAN